LARQDWTGKLLLEYCQYMSSSFHAFKFIARKSAQAVVDSMRSDELIMFAAIGQSGSGKDIKNDCVVVLTDKRLFVGQSSLIGTQVRHIELDKIQGISYRRTGIFGYVVFECLTGEVQIRLSYDRAQPVHDRFVEGLNLARESKSGKA
jgi:hypothetical protein